MYEYQNEGRIRPVIIAISRVWAIKTIPIDKGWFMKINSVFIIDIILIMKIISENSFIKILTLEVKDAYYAFLKLLGLIQF